MGPPGGGGPGGPGGPRGPGGPVEPLPAAPQQSVVLAGNVKTMGQLPQVFTGDRSQANNFIKEVKGYLHLNQDVAGFNLPIKKVAFMLMLIKGPDTAGWTRDMGDFLDGLEPADNIPDLLYRPSSWRNSGSNSKIPRRRIMACTNGGTQDEIP
jgi:hypothetical protein